jgi:hypothetical protein
MMGIGGNIDAVIQISTVEKNEYGLQVKTWQDVQTLFGWHDTLGGDSQYRVYNAKIQESTDVFICDYTILHPKVWAENSRMVIDGETYDIKLIDNPMRLKEGSQWEFFLKYTGGQRYVSEAE